MSSLDSLFFYLSHSLPPTHPTWETGAPIPGLNNMWVLGDVGFGLVFLFSFVFLIDCICFKKLLCLYYCSYVFLFSPIFPSVFLVWELWILYEFSCVFSYFSLYCLVFLLFSGLILFVPIFFLFFPIFSYFWNLFVYYFFTIFGIPIPIFPPPGSYFFLDSYFGFLFFPSFGVVG